MGIMDPQELLQEIRELLRRRNLAPMTVDQALANGQALAQKIQELDKSLSNAGRLPKSWNDAYLYNEAEM